MRTGFAPVPFRRWESSAVPINLFSILRLARSEELMGEHRNRGAVDWVTAATVASTSTLSLILVAVTVFGL